MIQIIIILFYLLCAPAVRADTGLYSFPKIEEKVQLMPEKKRVDPFIAALAKKLDISEETLVEEFKRGAGRSEMIRIILMAKKSGQSVGTIAREREKGTWFSKIAKKHNLDNRAIRKEALAILKELEREEKKLAKEGVRASTPTAGVEPSDPDPSRKSKP